ncbi:MAG: DUF3465 domain-containing protein [Myxococcota bacterium]
MSARPRRRGAKRTTIAGAALALLAALAFELAPDDAREEPATAPLPRSASPAPAAPTARDGSAPERAGRDDARIEEAFRERRSGLMVAVDARVAKTLRDDEDGSRHQRFLIELAGGRTLLVAHNIDLAPRVPLAPGDRVRVRGQYEWNERGGVLHWTHRDPAGSHDEGYVEHAGVRYE